MKPTYMRFGILIILLLMTACNSMKSVKSRSEHRYEAPTPILKSSATAQNPTPTVPPSVVASKTRFEQCAQIETTPLGILRLAWIDKGELWFWDWGEADPYSLTALVDVTSVRFSKDGSEIVFTRQTKDSAEIWAGNADGSNLHILTDGQILAGQIQMINFSFDENWLAFTHLLNDRGGELWAARL